MFLVNEEKLLKHVQLHFAGIVQSFISIISKSRLVISATAVCVPNVEKCSCISFFSRRSSRKKAGETSKLAMAG